MCRSIFLHIKKIYPTKLNEQPLESKVQEVCSCTYKKISHAKLNNQPLEIQLLGVTKSAGKIILHMLTKNLRFLVYKEFMPTQPVWIQ